MSRRLSAALLALAVVSPAVAQEGVLSRTGRALDNAGRNIRGTVETQVARGQITAQERELFNRIAARVDFDKKLTGGVMQMQVRPNGVVVLKGSVMSDAAKLRAVDLVENTLGVSSVVDELAVVREIKTVVGDAPVRATEETITVPAGTPVIVKP